MSKSLAGELRVRAPRIYRKMEGTMQRLTDQALRGWRTSTQDLQILLTLL